MQYLGFSATCVRPPRQNKLLEDFLHVWGGNSGCIVKRGPVPANRPSIHTRPSATKRLYTTIMALCHRVKTSYWKVLYMSGVKIQVLLRNEAQYQQINPVPPWGPVPTRDSGTSCPSYPHASSASPTIVWLSPRWWAYFTTSWLRGLGPIPWRHVCSLNRRSNDTLEI